jgi:hypothetical protein
LGFVFFLFKIIIMVSILKSGSKGEKIRSLLKRLNII